MFWFYAIFCVPFHKNNLGVNKLISHNLTKIKGCCEQKLTKLILESHNCQTDGKLLTHRIMFPIALPTLDQRKKFNTACRCQLYINL